MNDIRLGVVIEKVIECWREDPRRSDAGSPSGLRLLSAGIERTLPSAVLQLVKAAPAAHRDVIGVALTRLQQQDPAMREVVESLATPAAVRLPVAPTAQRASDRPEPASARPSMVFNQQSGVQTAGDYIVHQGATFGGDFVAGDKAVTNYGGGNTFGAGSVVSVGGRATPQLDPAAAAEQPITILFVGANPVDGARLRLDEEVRGIDAALRRGSLRDRFQLQQQWAVRMIDLQEALLLHRPQILHFSGHGSASHAIYIEDDAGGSMPIPADLLSRLLSTFSDELRCVVLNACYSAGQARAIAAHVDCVVGMAVAVGDRAAIQFAAAFYQALAYGSNVGAAFDLGCMQVQPESPGDESTPRLIALRCDARSIVLTRSGERHSP